MPVNKNVQQQEMERSRKSSRKAPGTRFGTVEDWREGSNKTGKISGRHGHTLRDGR